jgi:hypothetical protein
MCAGTDIIQQQFPTFGLQTTKGHWVIPKTAKKLKLSHYTPQKCLGVEEV